MRILLALLAVAVFAPSAEAWTRPGTVATYNEIENVKMFHGADDLGAIAWERDGDAWGFAALRHGAHPGPALRSLRLAGVAPGGAGRWLWLGLDSFSHLDANCGCRVPTSWMTSAAGSLRPGAAHPVAGALPYLDIPPAIAADQAGDALIAWVQEGTSRHDHVLVALRRAGGEFGKPHSVLTGDLTSVEVAMGDGGRFAIATVGLPIKRPGADLSENRLEVLRGNVTAGVKRHDLIDLGADFLAVDASVAADGSAAVAWWSDLNIDGPGHIYAATATPGGPLVVDSLAPTDTNVEEHARPAVLAEPGGRALAMWHDDSLSPSPVMLAASDATGHRTRIRRLTSCGETGDLTRWPDGRVLAAWTSCVDDTVVRAQSRTSRGSWGHVRTVHRGDDRNVATSIEPRSGRPVVAWVNYAYHRPHGPDALMVAAGDPRPHPRHGD